MTHIGSHITINGDIIADEPLRIDGTVVGDVLLRQGELAIGKEGTVDGSLRAPRVLVQGTIDGAISAGERIQLDASAQVTGSLSANAIVIVDGAHFSGTVDMDKRTIAAKVAQYKAQQTAAVP
jgi:cytoskeletal protein CcmA (bactofilin family)